jgi:hypothetical protein
MRYHRWEIETRDGGHAEGEDTFPCDALKESAKTLTVGFLDGSKETVHVPEKHKAVMSRTVTVEMHAGQNDVIMTETHSPNFHADYHIGVEDGKGKRFERTIKMRKGERVVDA